MCMGYMEGGIMAEQETVGCKDTVTSATKSKPENLIGDTVTKKKSSSESRRRGQKNKGTQSGAGSGHNKELGQRGEEAAAQYLFHRGYEIEQRNWSCKAGEADIIARDEDALVFVEVKTRMGAEKGHPDEAVDAQKRRRYEKIAALYLAQHDVVDVQVRFDVVSILVVAENRAFIRHHINAFGVGY